jgi:hypothetical protein
MDSRLKRVARRLISSWRLARVLFRSSLHVPACRAEGFDGHRVPLPGNRCSLLRLRPVLAGSPGTTCVPAERR